MGKLFKRRAALIIGTVGIGFESDADFRIAFKVSKNPAATEPNTAEVQVYNLNRSTRARLSELKQPITLEAGYESDYGAIFIGHTTDIIHSRQGPDVITRCICADGHLANEARVSVSFDKGATLGVVVKKLIDAIKKKDITTDIKNAVSTAAGADFNGALDALQKGLSIDGLAMGELNRIASGKGYEISVQDGELQLIKAGGTLVREDIVLGPATGMIGPVVPVRDEKNPSIPIVKFRSLMQPRLTPGIGVQLQSEQLSGRYKVRKATYSGDTHGPEWHVEVEAIQVDAAHAADLLPDVNRSLVA